MAYANLAMLPSQLNRGVSGLGCCGCGGSCSEKKSGLGHGVQEYVPNSWQEEFAAFSLGQPLFNPRAGRNLIGMGDVLDVGTWGMGTWAALIIGGAMLLGVTATAKKVRRVRRSRKAFRRVRGY